MRSLLLIPALMTASCVANSPPVGGMDAPDAPPAACTAVDVDRFLGLKASQSLGRDILEATNARELRWGGPDTAFTMDYREGRVNVIYDADGVVTRIYCG